MEKFGEIFQCERKHTVVQQCIDTIQSSIFMKEDSICFFFGKTKSEKSGDYILEFLGDMLAHCKNVVGFVEWTDHCQFSGDYKNEKAFMMSK